MSHDFISAVALNIFNKRNTVYIDMSGITPSIFEELPELPVSFVLASEKQLQVRQAQIKPRSSWRYFSYHISRFPLDLRVHSQRLFLTLNHDELSQYVAGVLQDLFIALRGKGFSLKERLLSLAKTHLDSNDMAYFDSWLAQEETHQRESRLGSVLDNGIRFKQEKLVILEQQDTPNEYGNALEEAQACLEYGQVDTAQALLEEAIIQQPDDQQIEQELLNIYQYTRDKAAFDLVTSQLQSAGHELSSAWFEVQEESSNWS